MDLGASLTCLTKIFFTGYGLTKFKQIDNFYFVAGSLI
jgi:hypothetical protein